MATRAEIEALLKLKDEMSAKLNTVSKRVDTLDKKTARAKKRTGELGKGLSDLAQRTTGLNPAMLGLAGAVTAVGVGIFKATTDTIALGEQLVNLSSKTGLTIQEIQELQFAAEQSGTNFEQLSNAVQRLGRRVAAELPETTKFMEKLGFTVDDIVSREPGEAFALVAEKIGQIKSPAEQAAAAMGVFGDAGLQVLPAINQGLTDNIERFRELGSAMSDETAQAAKKLADDLTDLKAQFTGIKTAIGSVVIPALSNMLKFFTDLLPGGIQKTTSIMLDFVAFNVRAIKTLVEALAILPDSLGGDVFVAAADGLNDFELRVKSLSKEFDARANANFKKFTQSLVDTKTNAPGAALELGRFSDEAKKTEKNIDSLAVSVEKMQETIRKGLGAPGARDLDLAKVLPPTGEVGALLSKVQEGIDRTRRWEEAQQAYNAEVARAADLIRILPGPLGSVVSLTTSAVAALKSLKTLGGGNILGGIAEAFKSGKGAGGGFLDILGGISGVASLAAPLIGVGQTIIKGIASLFKSGPNIVRDAARDLGATITQDMADEIERSGKPVQLAVADIFKAGGFSSIDRFAEEVGDIFSFIEQGGSRPEAIAALEESIPILLAHIGELGPAGEEQLQRIISAADRLGVSFEGLDALIQSTFAPKTMEEIAAQFGITNDKVRELGKTLGVDVQTNLERMASTLGLSVDQFRELGKAVEDEYGIPLDQIQELLDAMGINAEDLATALGVDLGPVQDGTDMAANNTERAAEAASTFADQLERAMRAAASIHYPAIPGGAPTPDVSAQGGFFSSGLSRDMLIQAHAGEAVAIGHSTGGGEQQQQSGGGGTSNITVTVDARGTFGLNGHAVAERIAEEVREGITRNTSGLREEIRVLAKEAAEG